MHINKAKVNITRSIRIPYIQLQAHDMAKIAEAEYSAKN